MTMKCYAIAAAVSLLVNASVTWAGVPGELSFSGATYQTEGLDRGGSGDFFHVEYFPKGQASTTAAKSLDFLRQPLTAERLDQVIDLHLKTLEDWKPKGVLTIVRKSETELVLREVRFDGTVTGKPFFILCVHLLEGHTLLTSQFIFRPRNPYEAADAFREEFTAKESRWLQDLSKVATEVQEAIRKEANKPSAAMR